MSDPGDDRHSPAATAPAAHEAHGPAEPPAEPASWQAPAWTLYVPESERVIAGSGSGVDLERWRHHEPTPWSLGLLVSAIVMAFCALVTVGVYSLAESLARGVGLLAVVVLASASAWTLWILRFRPVWRWIVWGALSGLLAGVGSAIALFALGQ
ncbi:DUF2537 domain-containing protein [Gordonia sp. DT30]|uniref:DUF2537 domain-containing protein n=1 Tax=unclassified Gordonia (in: high G+C Gram-positive bacteria) TaxID=2657482 RepID=UPI003CE73653